MAGKSGFRFVFLEGTQETCGCHLCDRKGAGDGQRRVKRPQQDPPPRGRGGKALDSWHGAWGPRRGAEKSQGGVEGKRGAAEGQVSGGGQLRSQSRRPAGRETSWRALQSRELFPVNWRRKMSADSSQLRVPSRLAAGGAPVPSVPPCSHSPKLRVLYSSLKWGGWRHLYRP